MSHQNFKSQEIIGLLFGVIVVIFAAVKVEYLAKDIALEVLTFIGVASAVSHYFYEKQKNQVNILIGLINFYRDVIINNNQKFIASVTQKKIKCEDKIILFSEPISAEDKNLDLTHIRTQYPRESLMQMKITQYEDLYLLQTETLNLLEEFSIKIFVHTLEKDEILKPLRATFVKLVETHLIALLRQHQIETGEDTYSNTLKLYYEWIGLVDRRTTKDRMTQEWSKLYCEAEKM